MIPNIRISPNYLSEMTNKNLSAQHFDEFGCILQFRQILFCFTMLQMPESQRNLMQQQLNGQHEASEELKERLKEMSQSKARAEFVSRQYIHDLYRFFKLWSRRHEIHDILRTLWTYGIKKHCLKPCYTKSISTNWQITYSHTTTWQKPEFSMINQLNYTIVKMPNYGRKQVSFIRKSVPIKSDRLLPAIRSADP